MEFFIWVILISRDLNNYMTKVNLLNEINLNHIPIRINFI